MGTLLRRFAYLLRWRQGQADLDEELAFHREMKEQELQDRLATDRATATVAARRELGSVALAIDRARDVWVPTWFQGIGQDVRLAVRSFRGTPVVTIVALLTLALGIGANTAIFSFTKAVLLAPLPYPDAERLVSLSTLFMPSGVRSSMTPLDYFDFAESGVFERVAATTGCCGIGVIDTGAEPHAAIVLRVSASYFDVFGAHAVIGRTFLPGEDQAGRDHVAVLSHKTWVALFGADPALIGRPIRLNRDTYTVVGVMPANSPFDRSLTQLWIPLSIPPAQMNRTNHWLISTTGAAVGLLKPGITIERGRAQLAAVAARLATEYPKTNVGSGVVLEPYAAAIVKKNAKDLLSLLSAAVGAVLLIGCVNLATVLLARGVARHRELAIRTALGAGRGRLIRQLLTESVLLSLCGGVLGLSVASVLTKVLETGVRRQALNPSMPPNWIPPEAVISVDRYVLAFTFVVSVVAAVAFGLVPAIWNTRRPASDGLSIHTQASVRTPRTLNNALLIAEFALVFLLLTGAGLVARSFVKMQQADTGFSATNVITASLPVPEHRFSNDEELRAYEERMIAAIEPLPGVRHVALTDGLPLQGVPTGRAFHIIGHPILDQARRPHCDLKIVSAAYFPAMGLRLRAGRTLGDGDRLGSPFVAVINETMERLHFAGTDPIGQHLVTGDTRPGTTEEIPWTIVGVIADERLTPFDDDRERPAVYVPLGQLATPFVGGLVVHTAGDPERLRDAIRHAITANDRDQLILDIKTVPQLETEALGPARLRTGFLGIFAVIALLLSAIGIYGVFAYAVAQQTHEIGIRTALGARSVHLTWMVVRRGLALIAVGLALGLAGALGGARFLQSFLFGVAPVDLPTLAGAGTLLALVAIAACLVPARRATRIDVVSALRADG